MFLWMPIFPAAITHLLGNQETRREDLQKGDIFRSGRSHQRTKLRTKRREQKEIRERRRKTRKTKKGEKRRAWYVVEGVYADWNTLEFGEKKLKKKEGRGSGFYSLYSCKISLILFEML